MAQFRMEALKGHFCPTRPELFPCARPKEIKRLYSATWSIPCFNRAGILKEGRPKVMKAAVDRLLMVSRGVAL